MSRRTGAQSRTNSRGFALPAVLLLVLGLAGVTASAVAGAGALAKAAANRRDALCAGIAAHNAVAAALHARAPVQRPGDPATVTTWIGMQRRGCIVTAQARCGGAVRRVQRLISPTVCRGDPVAISPASIDIRVGDFGDVSVRDTRGR